MSYSLTLTNGTPLLTLADGTLDNTTTSVNLIGRNYAGYGLAQNENFIHMLENFSSATSPLNPLVGQLWWDNTNRHLSVWQGTNWKVISSSQTGSTQPAGPVIGDFWWNTQTGIFSVYNGSSWTSIGPATPAGATVTSILANSITDSGSNLHTVGNILVNNKLSAVLSTDNIAFTLLVPESGLTTINPGFNLVSGLTVSANTNSYIFGNLAVSGNVSFTGNVSLPVTNAATFGNVVPAANLTYNLGSTTAWWNNIYGTAVHAQYADLAERFAADAEYDAGTVVELGGSAEITAVGLDLSEEVFGVISTKAAYLMNSAAGTDSTHPPIAVQGRVPVRVTGVIHKGDRLVSAGNGVARSGNKSEINAWNVIGRALENKTSPGEGIIEAVVKLNS